MKETHPLELDLQEYAMDKSSRSAAVTDHIESCTICLDEVNNYLVLFSEIKKEPEKVFDFDLATLVVTQLPSPRAILSTDQFIAGFLIVFISCFVAVPAYLFRTYILYMFSGISPFFVYAMISSVTVIVIYKSLETYRNYQKQIRVLNLN